MGRWERARRFLVDDVHLLYLDRDLGCVKLHICQELSKCTLKICPFPCM